MTDDERKIDMKKMRYVAAALVISVTAPVAVSLGAAASAAPGPGVAGAVKAADGTDGKAGKCRWVKGRGVVCETELGTIGL